jgi:exopolysaccharide production protein ExoY
MGEGLSTLWVTMQHGSFTGSAELLRPPLLHGHAADRPLSSVLGATAKSAFDRIVATVVVLLLLPLLAVVALLILVADGRPIFYRHTRVGRGGARFSCLKFRTMVRDADARLERLLAADPEARSEWERTQKLKRDPRIIPFGGLLRKSSIDELPQLLNVLRGEMSLVGPRPATPEQMGLYGHLLRDYAAVRPGITGPWQISGRNQTTFEERVRLDASYARRRSFLGDLRILLRTPAVVLRRSGAC